MELEFLFYLYLFVQLVRLTARVTVTWTLGLAAIRGQNELTGSMAYLFGSGVIEIVVKTSLMILLSLYALCDEVLLAWLLAGFTVVNVLRLAAFLSFTYQFYWGKDE